MSNTEYFNPPNGKDNYKCYLKKCEPKCPPKKCVDVPIYIPKKKVMDCPPKKFVCKPKVKMVMQKKMVGECNQGNICFTGDSINSKKTLNVQNNFSYNQQRQNNYYQQQFQTKNEYDNDEEEYISKADIRKAVVNKLGLQKYQKKVARISDDGEVQFKYSPTFYGSLNAFAKGKAATTKEFSNKRIQSMALNHALSEDIPDKVPKSAALNVIKCLCRDIPKAKLLHKNVDILEVASKFSVPVGLDISGYEANDVGDEEEFACIADPYTEGGKNKSHEPKLNPLVNWEKANDQMAKFSGFDPDYVDEVIYTTPNIKNKGYKILIYKPNLVDEKTGKKIKAPTKIYKHLRDYHELYGFTKGQFLDTGNNICIQGNTLSLTKNDGENIKNILKEGYESLPLEKNITFSIKRADGKKWDADVYHEEDVNSNFSDKSYKDQPGFVRFRTLITAKLEY